MRCKSVENEASLVLLLRALPWGFVGVFFFFFFHVKLHVIELLVLNVVRYV